MCSPESSVDRSKGTCSSQTGTSYLYRISIDRSRPIQQLVGHTSVSQRHCAGIDNIVGSDRRDEYDGRSQDISYRRHDEIMMGIRSTFRTRSVVIVGRQADIFSY